MITESLLKCSLNRKTGKSKSIKDTDSLLNIFDLKMIK